MKIPVLWEIHITPSVPKNVKLKIKKRELALLFKNGSKVSFVSNGF